MNDVRLAQRVKRIGSEPSFYLFHALVSCWFIDEPVGTNEPH